MIRTYTELIKLKTYKERFEYLKLDGVLGSATFGENRYANQQFYRSERWRRIRRKVILRDKGCDLGVEGYEINKGIIIHHMNPVMLSDIIDETDILLNPEYLICCSHDTHNAIHYGNIDNVPDLFAIRAPNDQIPWR